MSAEPLGSVDLASHEEVSASVDGSPLAPGSGLAGSPVLDATVEALARVVGLARPEALTRGQRIGETAADLADELSLRLPELPTAAVLSQVGAVALPEAVMAKLYRGLVLDDEERELVRRQPRVAASIVGDIPGLEGVAILIRLLDVHIDVRLAGDWALPARLLRAAVAFDRHTASGLSPAQAVRRLRDREALYGSVALDALARRVGTSAETDPVAVSASELVVGMTLAADVTTTSGVCLVPGGHLVTEQLFERVLRFAHRDQIREPIWVAPGRLARLLEQPAAHP